ncbi:MAG: mechanosensitive ion channel [Azospirillum sp.]|nr:mechanosensitive ion channel [Azospirillum sp.]
MPTAVSLRRLIPPGLLWLLSTTVYLWPPIYQRLGAWLPVMTADGLRLTAGTVSWLALAWFGHRLFDLVVAQGRARPLPQLLNDLVEVVLFALALFAIMAWVFDQPVTGLIATSGVAVAVIGFALRDIISDIFSGIALNLEQPYAIGDWLEVQQGGPVGKVVEITWRATRMVTQDQTSVVVPNGVMARGRFMNFSTPQRHFRVNFPVVLEYDIPVERAHRLLLAATRNLPLVMAQPEPDVVAESFTERGVRYLVRFYVADYSVFVQCRHQIAASLHRHLRLGGVPLPHARQDLTLARAGRAVDPRKRRTALLAHVGLFQALSDDDLRQLGDGLAVRCIATGEAVVRQGEPGASLFVVVEGLLRVEVDAVAVGTLGPGDVFGEMSLLTGDPRSATVTAETAATLFEISDEQLRPILRHQPELVAGLGAIMAERQHTRPVAATADAEPGDHRPAVPLLVRIRDFFGLAR